MSNPLLDKILTEYDLNFERYWKTVFTEYRDVKYNNSMWLAGPSSYVFSLSNRRFAVDLIIRRKSDLDRVSETLLEDLSDISFILITHQHDDHFCLHLMRALKDAPIRWYIPEGVRGDLIAMSELNPENITYVRAGEVIHEGEISIRVFNTPHLTKENEEQGEQFTEVGYEIISPCANILIPADVRDYEYNRYPKFDNIDLCISHLWAGANALDPAKYSGLLDDFASFSAKFGARRYFICHLYEIGRGDIFMWHDGHADIVKARLGELLPSSEVIVPRLGNRYSLYVEEG